MSATERDLARLIPLKRKVLQMLKAARALPELLRKQVLELAELRSTIAHLRARLEVCEARRTRLVGGNSGAGGNQAVAGGEDVGEAGFQAVPQGLHSGDPYTHALRALLQARQHERELLEAQVALVSRAAPAAPAAPDRDHGFGWRQDEPVAVSSGSADALDALDVFRDLL